MQVLKNKEGKNVPDNDLYGLLYLYIRNQLTEFVKRIKNLQLTFRLHNTSAQVLSKEFTSSKPDGVVLLIYILDVKFDRIEVSNIVDKNYLGLEKVLEDWSPRLNRNNPCSTLITTFMNWFTQLDYAEIVDARQRMDLRAKMSAMQYSKYGYPYYADITPAFEKFMSEMVRGIVIQNVTKIER